MCCKRARPHKGRPTSLIRDIRDRASGGNQTHEASHPSRARPSEPNSTPPTGPAGLLMQPETASAINTGGPLHESLEERARPAVHCLRRAPRAGLPAQLRSDQTSSGWRRPHRPIRLSGRVVAVNVATGEQVGPYSTEVEPD